MSEHFITAAILLLSLLLLLLCIIIIIISWKEKKQQQQKKKRCEQGSNLRGETPLDFKSNALTTRPSQPHSKSRVAIFFILRRMWFWR